MVDIMNTAVSGLMASQRGLATVGHNIANVNTPEYSRQRLELSTPTPQQPVPGLRVGTGVQVDGIHRVYDTFLSAQVRSHQGTHSQLEALDAMTRQVGSLLSDEGSGLAPALEQFFAAVQDVADLPASAPARQVLLTQSQSLADRLVHVDGQLQAMGGDVNRSLQDTVSEINALAASIAQVNTELSVQSGGDPNRMPADLLDRRDALVRDLTRRVGVQVVSDGDGALSVFVGKGQPLVAGNRASRLVTEPSAVDPRDLAVRLEGQLAGADLSDVISGGRLGGLVAFRRDVLEPARNSLGLLAQGIAATFNAQHRKGMDLAGNPGQDFFAAGAPRVVPNAANAGTASVSVEIADVGAALATNYELRFDGTDYHLRRESDGQVTTLAGAGPHSVNVDGLSLEIAGSATAGDRFALQPTREGARDFAVVVGGAQEVAAAVPVRATAATGNLGSATLTGPQVPDPDPATAPDLNPALGNSVEIRFTSPTTYEVVDVTDPSNPPLLAQAYTSGGAIDYNGWQVRIDGTPQAGDVFLVEENAGGVGDNGNALALAGLQSRLTLLPDASGQPGADFHAAYARLVAEVGAQGGRTSQALESQQVVLDRAVAARESVSGVNLDEEAADLMRLQKAYEASAQMIRVADSLIETLLGVARR